MFPLLHHSFGEKTSLRQKNMSQFFVPFCDGTWPLQMLSGLHLRDEKFTLNHLVVTYFRCGRIDFVFGSRIGSAVGCAWKPERNPWNSSRPLKGNSPVALLLINSWLKFYTTNSLYTKNHSKKSPQTHITIKISTSFPGFFHILQWWICKASSRGDARLPSVEDLEGFARQMLGFEISYSHFWYVFFFGGPKNNIRNRGGRDFFSRTFLGWFSYVMENSLSLSL